MNRVACKILKTIERKGEISLHELSNIIPKAHGDHRDFYILASLVSSGFVEDNLLEDPDKPDPNKYKMELLAWRYFACKDAGKTAKFENRHYSISGADHHLKDQPFFLTGKGFLYLDEYRTKRFERLFALITAIFVGVLVAVTQAALDGNV